MNVVFFPDGNAYGVAVLILTISVSWCIVRLTKFYTRDDAARDKEGE